MKTKNEKTSKKVSKIAGKILSDLKGTRGRIWIMNPPRTVCDVDAADLKSVIASALTQSPDKK